MRLLTLFSLKQWLLLLVATSLILVAVPKANAANFKLDKTRVVLDETTSRDEIRIYNDSDVLQSFKVSLIEMEMNEEGSLIEVESYAKSAKPYLRIGPRISRDVKPHTFQKVRIIKKESPKAGEYRSHLVVEALNQEPVKQVSGIFIRPNLKYVIPVFVVQGQEGGELQFGEPVVTDEGKLDLVMTRTGEGSVSGNIVVTDKNSEEIYRANQVSIYPELSRRMLKTELNIADFKGQSLTFMLEDPKQDNEIVVQRVLTL
ncbi:hypothetical protein KIH87_05750 [Paraneptunicella aestuarii]|uniref:hypothetical protein n=1 Tax=Paraneptunicella aestuarii TaxID=2831148 RepID=UPI001E3C2758|nr:hypothetical protein [Paraneptunicella aestuarii]UAA39857.1 hypothetical protein KIH87_05750 [Paraneptunicella aestuarii]